MPCRDPVLAVIVKQILLPVARRFGHVTHVLLVPTEFLQSKFARVLPQSRGNIAAVNSRHVCGCAGLQGLMHKCLCNVPGPDLSA